ncbi:MAG: DUF1572 family protein [Pyrinomonadaceae bacterium]
MSELSKHYLEDAITTFRAYKKLAEKALDQITDDEFFVTIDSESNSVAVIMKHIAGNMFSRWTEFLTTDGEKPDRDRDMEFVIEPQTTKTNVLAYWEKGWQRTFETLEALQPADLMSTVTICGEAHTVVQAINRQLAHYPYHIGQVVFLAKHFRSGDWKSLSVPKNKSAEFNKYLEEKGVAAGRRFDAAASFNEPDRKDN